MQRKFAPGDIVQHFKRETICEELIEANTQYLYRIIIRKQKNFLLFIRRYIPISIFMPDLTKCLSVGWTMRSILRSNKNIDLKK